MAQQIQSISPDNPNPVDDSQMTLMEHLMELRSVMIWIAAAVFIGSIVSMIFANAIIAFLAGPVESVGNRLITISPTDPIIVFFKISFTAGTIIAMPVIVYQIISFVAPGLYPHEKRILLSMLPGVMVLFALGAAFAFWIMIPLAVQFLSEFMSAIEKEWTIDRYYGFVTRIVFWIGVAFEMPLVITALARIGLVDGPSLLHYWRHAIVVIAIIAAFITPTVDPVNMAIVMAPLIVLYALSVGLAYLVYRPREPRDFSN